MASFTAFLLELSSQRSPTTEHDLPPNSLTCAHSTLSFTCCGWKRPRKPLNKKKLCTQVARLTRGCVTSELLFTPPENFV